MCSRSSKPALNSGSRLNPRYYAGYSCPCTYPYPLAGPRVAGDKGRIETGTVCGTNLGSYEPQQNGTWGCGECTYLNPQHSFVCSMCDMARGTAAAVAGLPSVVEVWFDEPSGWFKAKVVVCRSCMWVCYQGAANALAPQCLLCATSPGCPALCPECNLRLGPWGAAKRDAASGVRNW